MTELEINQIGIKTLEGKGRSFYTNRNVVLKKVSHIYYQRTISFVVTSDFYSAKEASKTITKGALN
jgi:hypothetical protein